MSDLKLLTLNIRGIRDDTKRGQIFNYLGRKKHNILCLQETHCIEKSIKYGTLNGVHQCIFLILSQMNVPLPHFSGKVLIKR